ncbi:DAK2 domain-containing protein [Apilactobacillus xinyiensis]|uniref:DAK2 domain-containing protein n=1 Tax=Apilactobacillus xinyiensis TaxID=2841032 RepID=A0ABT0HZZ2_9LACO|nr:DAK2 domain-containing protein [Apilactobacillus xinyiensis]MCK8624158.1 DAK2 domain-containing protein [Apilactobacillus xinyiensis]MCL0318376.1 DAK2 domain-containing protein [Apilactobacillus xinyiensis]
MVVKQITNIEFNKMVQAAAHNLKQNMDFINSLNVFPVPDGDTGTNMSMSFSSGASYVAKNQSNSVGELAQSLAKGLLMGARGNSGVILSQIFRGFSKSVEDKEVLTVNDVTKAFLNSAKVAYGSVMKPTEGTILTVIKGIAQAAKDCNDDTEDVAVLMDKCYESAELALKSTTELLPVLKQVGVVDSGGQGLVFVVKAFADVLNNRFNINDEPHQPNNHEMNEMIDASHEQGKESVQGKLDPNDIVYGYCTQVMVRIGKGKQVEHDFDYDFFYDYLSKLGDSLLVINDDEIVKVHIHTEFPGKILSWAQKFGDLSNIKVDNMRMQQEDIIEQDDNSSKHDNSPKDVAIIAVTSGDGLGELFKSLGATDLIKGGQTMNPSTEDLLNAINQSNAKSAILLPNNGNIFMAAEEAAKVSDIPTKIVHSKTLAQGMTAIISFNPEQSADENCKVMEEMLDTVKSGEITNAVRDTTINNLSIKKDDFMGIVDGKIEVNGKELIKTATDMVNTMLDEDSEIVTIIYGQQGDLATANQIKEAVQALDEDLEIEIHDGGQPVYPFLISVE